MCVVQHDGLFRLVADFQKLPQTFGYSGKVNSIQNICGVVAIPTQIAGRDAKIVGFEVLCQYLQRETVVDVFY